MYFCLKFRNRIYKVCRCGIMNFGVPREKQRNNGQVNFLEAIVIRTIAFHRSKARSLEKISKKSSQQTYSGDWINQRTFQENAGEKMKKKHICISFPLVFCMYELNNRCVEENQRYLP